MKKISSVVCLSVLVLLLLVSTVIGSDWVEYNTDVEGNVHYYDKGSIQKSKGKYTVQVWEKIVLSDKRKEDIVKINTRNGSSEGYDKFEYYVDLSEIDCKKKKFRSLSITDYDTDGVTLYNHDYDDNKWTYIIPDSIIDTLRKKVCE